MPYILIIDADASAAQVTSAIVQRIMPTALVACEATPAHGWQLAQRCKPDVLIIDPPPDDAAALMLIQLCKEQNPSLQVIVLASRLTPGLRRQIQKLNVHVYLEKPTASTVLVEQIRDGLNPQVVMPHARQVLEPTCLS